MFHASGLQAVIQRGLYCKQFFFLPPSTFPLVATGDHHIKTPLFMFSLLEKPPPLPFCPLASKDVSSFYMIGLDLQESPPLSSCFVLRAKSGESDGGSIRGGGMKGRRAERRGSREQRSEGGNWAEGFFFIRVPTMLTIKACVCVYVWERDAQRVRKRSRGLNIFTQFLTAKAFP